MKPILPVLKEKNRYVVFEIISDKKISNNHVKSTIIDAFKRLFGEIDYANSAMMFISNASKDEKNTYIIKIKNKYVDMLKTTLLSIGHIDKCDVVIKTKSISGILKKAKSKV